MAIKVLLVNPIPTERMIVEKWLQLAGYAINAAQDTATAIQKQSESNFDLVITYQDGIGLTGVELARKLKERWPELKVILIGRYVDKGHLYGPCSPIEGFVSLPLSRPTELLSIVKRLMVEV